MNHYLKDFCIFVFVCLTLTALPSKANNFTAGNEADFLKELNALNNANTGPNSFSITGDIMLLSRPYDVNNNVDLFGTDQTNYFSIDGNNNYASLSFNGSDKTATVKYLNFTNLVADINNKMKELTISDASFTNTNTNSAYGIISNYGGLVLNNVTFDNNHVGYGAIYNSGSGTISIDNSTFSNNSAGMAGAIYNEGGDITITDSKFESNITVSAGGAISHNAANSTLSINNSVFDGNKAQMNGYGGAIYIANGTLEVTGGSLFQNNSSVQGGAIFIAQNAIATISDSNFVSNSDIREGGSAIFNQSDNVLNILSSTFDKNTATGTGTIFTSGTGGLNVDKCIFTNNKGDGGGISSAGGKITVSNSTFDSNSADRYGALYITGPKSSLFVTSSTFNKNTSGRFGGAIFISDDMQLDNSIFTDNSAGSGVAGDGGGAIFVMSGIQDITNSKFESNKAIGNGGAIYNNSVIQVQVNLSDTTFSSNTATGIGGAIYNEGKLDLTSCIIEKSHSQNGGAIYNKLGTLNVAGTKFDSNIAGNYGGAIYNAGGAQSTVNNSIFVSNTVSGMGGAIYNESSKTFTISSSTFDKNQAHSGGAVTNGTNGVMKIDSSIFSNNIAPNLGGAIYNQKGTLEVSGSKFESNLNTKSGGAIYNEGVLTVKDSSLFQGNTALYEGGAIYNYSGAKTDISDSQFVSNSATDASGSGGAIYNELAGSITIKDNTAFQNNIAGQDGGAIYNKGTLNLSTNSGGYIVFKGNESSIGKNDIHNDNGTIIIDGNHGFVGFDEGISGTGTILKEGSGALMFSNGSDSSKYTGKFTHTAGSTEFYGKFFSGESEVNGGTFAWYTNQDKDTNGTLKVTGGTFIVGSSANQSILTLNNAKDEIQSGAVIKFAENSEIRNDLGTVTFNNDGDVWGGKVTNNSMVILDGFIQNDDAHGEHHQASGVTILKNKAQMTIGGKSIVTGGDMHVTTDSVLTAGSKANFQNIDNFYINTGGVFNTGVNPFNVGNTMAIDRGTVNSMNGVVTANNIGDLNVGAGGGQFNIDIDAFNAVSDRFVANSITGAGNLNLNQLQLIGKAPTAEKIYFTLFDSNNIDSNVTFSTTNSQVKTPYYIYNLSSEGEGIYSLIRPGSSGGDSDPGINPQVYRGQVATLAMFNNQLLVNQALFDHVYLDSEELIARAKYANQYAAISPLFAPYQYTKNEGGIWYKAYAAFDSFNMTRGLSRVANNAYGSIIGADFTPVNLGHGWKFLPTPYISYNGGHQTFSGVGMYQDGGQLGFMGSFLKKDFIASFLTFGGGYQNNMNVEGFTDRTGNWFAGCACKAAYNFHPTRNLIVQPNALISYMIFGNQNWGSNFGQISMNSGFLNGINLAPGVNLIYGRKSWSVYASIQYMYFINDKLNGRIGSENLASVRMKHGYIAYGVGVVKSWKERLSGYLQVMMYNGGINGVGFQLGINYKI